MPTPADEFNTILVSVRRFKRRLKSLSDQERQVRKSINSQELRAAAIIRKAVGFVNDDVVTDSFNNMYRVTNVQLPSFYWESLTKLDGFQKTLDRVTVKGLLLNTNGVPVWQKERVLRGKLRRFDEGSGQ